MNSQVQDPKLKQILTQLEKFGFTFFSFDENGIPIVKGPNSQLVPINFAIDFVNKQIESYRQSSSSGSLESGPALNQNIDTAASAETSVERNIEVQKERIDDKQEKQSQQQQISKDLVVKQQSPQVQIKQPKISLYDQGFDVKSFDPSDINQTLNFIERNQTKSAKSSNAWLATLFKKFLDDIEEDKN